MERERINNTFIPLQRWKIPQLKHVENSKVESFL